MDLKAANNLLIAIGPLTGLADSDLADEFADGDANDEAMLSEWIDRYLVPDFRKRSADDRSAALAALLEMSKRPRAEAERRWDSYLPPFDYPEEINLFALIHGILKERG